MIPWQMTTPRSEKAATLLIALLLTLPAFGCIMGSSEPNEPNKEIPAAAGLDSTSTPDSTHEGLTAGPIIEAAINPETLYPESLDQMIYRSDLIVRASLVSVMAAAEALSGGDGESPTYRPLHKLRFTVHEYLKGSGPAEILVVVRPRYRPDFPISSSQSKSWYSTEAEAREQADWLLTWRNRNWDDRQALLFLNRDTSYGYGDWYDMARVVRSSGESQPGGAFVFPITESASSFRRVWDNAIDTLSRVWLPANSTDVPDDIATMEFITDGSVSPQPVISLAAFRSQKAELEATLKAGEGIEGFRRCIVNKIWREQHMLANPDWPDSTAEKALDSGLAAGTEVSREREEDPYSTDYHNYWLSGDDMDLFRSVRIDEDSDPANGYEDTLETSRPLAAGVYRVRHNWQHYANIPCNYKPDDSYVAWTVTAVAPSGTIHEAFFDPVTVGSAVTADGSNGVLRPATFTGGDGASATVESISYEAGKVKVKIVPWPVLSGKVMDFIELDGTMSLSLNVTNSAVETASNTLTWSVSSQPWDDGDELMVRIRRLAPFAPAPQGLRTSDVGGDSISLSWNSVGGVTGYVVERRASGVVGWETVDAKVTEKTYPVSGLSCGTAYEFRVGAYGDGTQYESAAGPRGYATVSETTDSCSPQQPPAFDAASYSFEVSEDAVAGTQVGTVSATDPDEGDTLTYSITAGNEGGKFAIDGSTGVITVAGTLDHETVSSYTLTAQADDGEGGTATASVQINVLATGAPVFGASAYSFSIIEDASVGTTVGAVSATDPNEGDTVTYSITSGNDDGKFAIDASKGRITVAGALDYETVSSYTLTAQASDGNSDAATATVTVSIEKASCSNGTAVPSPDDNPGLVADCLVLLTNRDALEGTAVLNWSADTPISQWKGVTVGGTPKRAQRLALSDSGLDGVVPGALSGLAALTRLDLSDNRLSGGVPASLGGMTKLDALDLEYNQLTGTVPTALGALTELRRLSLSANRLTGTIPAELGKLTRLTALDLAENRLSGTIPAELKNLTALRYLSLGSNRLAGAVPPWLTSLSTLQDLYLDRNALTGAIPAGLGGLSDLRVLSLGSNQLTGTIPPALGSLSKLDELALSRNNLTGAIPDALADLDLDYLYLSGNSLTGCVPAGLRAVANNDLDRLNLPYCATSSS